MSDDDDDKDHTFHNQSLGVLAIQVTRLTINIKKPYKFKCELSVVIIVLHMRIIIKLRLICDWMALQPHIKELPHIKEE
jgi:hypothetical protein